MIEIGVGVSEFDFVEVTLPEGFDFEKTEVVISGANTLLAKMKNTEDEGGHGH